MRPMYRLLIPLCLLAAACYSPRGGALSPEARGELYAVAHSSLETEKKYLRLAEKTAQLLQEAYSIPREDSAMAHIRRFYFDNETAIEKISREFDGWQRYASSEEVADFLGALLNQPYSRTLRDLTPAFRQRVSYYEPWVQEFDAFMRKLSFRH
ncbi:MAG: hypothetical protein NW241_23155 [Bacteroidia bacterium]|nr:hypothetical protein [Bacteroidia bacterium]